MGILSRPRTARAWVAFVASAALPCLPARASAAGARYRLELVRAEGAGSCPAAAAIERDVSARLGRNPFSPTGERGIEVVVERAEPLWRARLYLRLDPNEPDQARVLESEAADCAELGKAVTLAVSLAIAPDLAPEPPPPEPICPPPLPPPPTPPPPPTTAGAARPSLHREAGFGAVY